MAQRRQNFQNISWFWDLRQRNRLDMEPPYQRRSVWSDEYRQQFIDTVLLDYPAPAIFLFSRIDDGGITTYELVDGKQRLTTIFDFLEDRLQVGDDSPLKGFRGKYFSQLDQATKVSLYEYNFSVEYLPTNNEEVINNIFDRLNRNVRRLTPQELRHARFDGFFVSAAERLADWMETDWDANFPRIALPSRRQMKDVEFVATLLLLLEEGPKSYSVDALDEAFSKRDQQWDTGQALEQEFREVLQFVRSLASDDRVSQSRLRNQADFYSLFGAVAELHRSGELGDPKDSARRLVEFVDTVDDASKREGSPQAQAYYEAARSASNDAGPRATRIRIVKQIVLGQSMEPVPQ